MDLCSWCPWELRGDLKEGQSSEELMSTCGLCSPKWVSEVVVNSLGISKDKLGQGFSSIPP